MPKLEYDPHQPIAADESEISHSIKTRTEQSGTHHEHKYACRPGESWVTISCNPLQNTANTTLASGVRAKSSMQNRDIFDSGVQKLKNSSMLNAKTTNESAKRPMRLCPIYLYIKDTKL